MDTMNNMNTMIKGTYESLKPSMNINFSIQTMKDVIFLLFILFCAWNIAETCMKLYNFGMSSAIKMCFVGLVILGYIYYQDNNEDNESNE